MEYSDFLETKKKRVVESGFEVNENELNKNLFDFQKHIVKKALKAGKYAIFADCGLGKTIMQLEWAKQVTIKTNKPVLVLCPLAVSGQTIKEGKKFGILVEKYKDAELNNDLYNCTQGIYISNYEQLENIDCDIFSGIVLDESSILKNYSGAYKNLIIDKFANTQYKLACTATPSPNDELEIGNHAEFLNICSSQDMRSVYFVTDKDLIKGDKYRLKKHAEKEFYKWISTWSIVISSPVDCGFDGSTYILPKLKISEIKIQTSKQNNGLLFNSVSVSATDFNKELRRSFYERLDAVIETVNNSSEKWIIWCKLNDESDYLQQKINDCKQVKGLDKQEYKEATLLGFANNEFKVLITKPKIAMFGLNYQNCNNQIFASLDFSFEQNYQCIRRSWRFGQKNDVNIYLVTTDTMQNVINTINDKFLKFKNMQEGIIEQTKCDTKITENIETKSVNNNKFYKALKGDCIEQIKTIPSNSQDYCFFSPPFGALYVFSNNPADLSNVTDNDEFMQHFEFLVPELLRVMKAGRLISIHIMQGTTLLGRDGYYSIKDLRGEIIRLFQKYGFYFHEEHMIRKDPKTAAIRTKNRQLMWGQTQKDSTISRPGLADYILSFKKPGENLVPVNNNIPFDLWCKMAEPVWLDIEEGDTLEFRSAKDNKDERHLTPTQLKAIEWCYLMYSNKNENIFCPFGGIFSEGVKAIEMDRFITIIELKDSYFEIGVKNLTNAVENKNQKTLFE